jgi:hypothetical protein
MQIPQFTINNNLITQDINALGSNEEDYLLTKYSKLYNTERIKALIIINDNREIYNNLCKVLKGQNYNIIKYNPNRYFNDTDAHWLQYLHLINIFEIIGLANKLEITNMNYVHNEEFIKNFTIEYSDCFDFILTLCNEESFLNELNNDDFEIKYSKYPILKTIKNYFECPDFFDHARFIATLSFSNYRSTYLLNNPPSHFRVNNIKINNCEEWVNLLKYFNQNSSINLIDNKTYLMAYQLITRYLVKYNNSNLSCMSKEEAEDFLLILTRQDRIIINYYKEKICTILHQVSKLQFTTSSIFQSDLSDAIFGMLIFHSISKIYAKHTRCIIKNHKDLFEAIILHRAQNNKLHDNRDKFIWRFFSCENNFICPYYGGERKKTKTLIGENFHKELYKTHPFDTSKFMFPDEIKKTEYEELLGISGKFTKAAKK